MSEFLPVISQAFEVMKDFGAMAMHLKVAAVLTLLISFVKVSALRPSWDKLGAAKVLVAPFLALVLAVVQSIGSKPFSAVELMNALLIGAGAVALHEFLDAFKQLPVIRDKYVWIVDFVSKLVAPKA